MPIMKLTAIEMFEKLLRQCVQMNGSDLHIGVGRYVRVRKSGTLVALQEQLDSVVVHAIIDAITPPSLVARYVRDQGLDIAWSLSEGERFRINLYHERGEPALAVRRLDNQFRTFEDLYLPQGLSQMLTLRDGLVLVSGATGSGKSTTLATVIHEINRSQACHILTIEDPVEYVHTDIKSMVHQRELAVDVPSYAQAVRAALREDPDVILVGEMRDIDTIRAAVTAAETGHLVFSTLHTGDAVGVVERIIGAYPAEEQPMIRQQLSRVLRMVVAQRLLPLEDAQGRVPAVEVMHVNVAVANLIRTGKTQQIQSLIESDSRHGMQTLEQSLADLVLQGLISRELAFRQARDGDILSAQLRIRRQG